MCLETHQLTASRAKSNHRLWCAANMLSFGILFVLVISMGSYLLMIAAYVSPATVALVGGVCALVTTAFTVPFMRIGFHQRKVIAADDILMAIIAFCLGRPNARQIAAQAKIIQPRIDELLKD